MAKKENDPRAEFYETHSLIGRLMSFPPFSVDQDLRRTIERESIAAIEALRGSDIDSEWNSAHNPLLKKYFEEASMWSARTSGNASEAQELALAIEGKSPEEIQTYKFLQ
jgi:hypothetical protein